VEYRDIHGLSIPEKIVSILDYLFFLLSLIVITENMFQAILYRNMVYLELISANYK